MEDCQYLQQNRQGLRYTSSQQNGAASSMFPSQILGKRVVQIIVQEYRAQLAELCSLSRRLSRCGGGTMKFSIEAATKLMQLSDKYWGQLSCKILAGKMREEMFGCATLGASRKRRYIKPKLSLRQKYSRLTWALDHYSKKQQKFLRHLATCHGDEKWFHLLKDGTMCRVFLQYERGQDGELERIVRLPACASICHKSHLPKGASQKFALILKT